jgi:hypothetical protein
LTLVDAGIIIPVKLPSMAMDAADSAHCDHPTRRHKDPP